MQLCHADAASAHLYWLIGVLFQNLTHAPEGDRAILHSASDDASLIELVGPVERREPGRALCLTQKNYTFDTYVGRV